jgi:hypothetical protein
VKKSIQTLLAIILACSIFPFADAGTVRFASGDVGWGGGPTGVIELRIDLDPSDSLQAGGIFVSVVLDNLDVLKFTGATVYNPAGRWQLAEALPTPDAVEFNIVSVDSPAFPTGGQNQLVATINYERTGYNGVSQIRWLVEEESLVDGRNGGTIVTQNYQFIPNFIGSVPEPGTLTMFGIGLMGLAMRRLNP